MTTTSTQDQLRAAAVLVRDPKTTLTDDARALLAASLDEQADALTAMELLVLTTSDVSMTLDELDASLERQPPGIVRFARAVIGEENP